MNAADFGNSRCAALLLSEAGHQSDSLLKYGIPHGKKTALMLAAVNGWHKIVQILVDKEARMQDDANMTALVYAAYNGHVECVKILARPEKGIVV